MTFRSAKIHRDLRLAFDLVSRKLAFRLTDEARRLLEENLKLGNEKVVIKGVERGGEHQIQWEIEIPWKDTLIIPSFDVLQYD